MAEGSVTRWSLTLRDEPDTASLAATVAGWLRADDLLTLSGDLGSGKTTFARALIRTLVGDPDLEVPSPTFTLMQIYDTPAFPVVHADLYRVASLDEVVELGWDEAAEGALVVVEWADRLGDTIAPDRIDLHFALSPEAAPDRREVTVTGHGRFAARLDGNRAVDALLPRAGFEGSARSFITGDASTRLYERLVRPDGRTAVLMVNPPRADPPAGTSGRPYHHVARLAHDIGPYLAIDKALRAQGVSAPELYAYDRAAGLAVLEDLGSEPCVDGAAPIPERYLEAVGLLARLHGATLPGTVPLDDDLAYDIPPYDAQALGIEVDLLPEWYAPQIGRAVVPASGRAAFAKAWAPLFEDVLAGPKTWCLRDFHSPNLIWLAGRRGTARVGLVDFQDTVIGHPAYDLASLLQDARVTVPDGLELKLLGAYAQMRLAADPGFDRAAFVRAYAILGVQRATKILGIFARLDRRDGKPQYLAHLPRMEAYLGKGLAHPALAELKGWFEAYLPRALGRETAAV